MSSSIWSTHPWIKKSSIKLITCVYVCAPFRCWQLEKKSSTCRETWEDAVIVLFFFCLITCHKYPPFETNVPQCSMLFCSVWMILKPRQSIKYECDSTVCQNTTKTSCNMEFGFEWVSEGSSWWPVRRDVNIVCLLSEVLQGRRKEWQSPGRGPNRTFQSLLFRDWPLNPANQVLYTNCCSNLDRRWPLQL